MAHYARRGQPGEWFVVIGTSSTGVDLYWVGLLNENWLHMFTQNNAIAAQFDTREQAAFNARMLGLTNTHRIEKHRWKEPA